MWTLLWSSLDPPQSFSGQHHFNSEALLRRAQCVRTKKADAESARFLSLSEATSFRYLPCADASMPASQPFRAGRCRGGRLNLALGSRSDRPRSRDPHSVGDCRSVDRIGIRGNDAVAPQLGVVSIVEVKEHAQHVENAPGKWIRVRRRAVGWRVSSGKVQVVVGIACGRECNGCRGWCCTRSGCKSR